MINKNNKNGFTLVELLAVIVILAIILVIAVPKIMDVINDAKKATLESTAKMIASAAEKAKVQNTVLGKDERITCENVAKINNLDYEDCDIDFDDNIAKVTIKGSGKFEGLYVCNGDKTNSEATEEECDLTCEYGTKEVIKYEIKNEESCVAFMTNIYNEADLTEYIELHIPLLCSGNSIGFGDSFSEDISILIEELTEDGVTTEQELIENNVIVKTKEEFCLEITPDECFAFDLETGTITGYDISCGTDVVIPNKINNVTVTAIGEAAFTSFGEEVAMLYSDNEYNISNLEGNNDAIGITPIVAAGPEGIGITSVFLPNTIITIGPDAFIGNLLTELNIPGSVTTIDDYAFIGNLLTELNIPSSVTTIGYYAFSGNLLTELNIPSSVTTIDDYAFYENPLNNVYLGNQDANLGMCVFGRLDNIETHNLASINYICR